MMYDAGSKSPLIFIRKGKYYEIDIKKHYCCFFLPGAIFMGAF